MKSWKRFLAFGIVILMLVSMIPAGIFQTSALNYSKSEFCISNLSDWNDVASSSENFKGKTVKLTQDFDAGGAELTTLFENFAGTFDGQGYTIKNFTATNALLAERTLSGAVIKDLTVDGTVTNNDEGTLSTGLLVARHDDTEAGSLTVIDVTVEGRVIGASQHVGGVFGVLTLRDGQTATLSNIDVRAQVKNQRGDLTHACISVGGVVGIFEPIGRPELTICGVRMSGEVVGELTTAGGILGSVFTSDYMEDHYAGGKIAISNCEISGSVSSSVTNTIQGVGGIVGSFGGFKRDYGEFTAYDGELHIHNCVIGGELFDDNGINQITSVGGVLGTISYQHSVVTVEHCLITASFPKNSVTAKDGTGAAIILGTAASHKLTTLNVNNTVTTHKSFEMVGSVVANEESLAVQLVLNGQKRNDVPATYDLGRRKYCGAITDGSVATVSQSAAKQMVKTNADGFITKVGGQITVLGVQDNVADGATLTASDTYAIRFISITNAKGAQYGEINVIARETATGTVLKNFTANEAKLYDGLTAYDHNGAIIQSYRTRDFGGEKFIALIIKNIPAGEAYTFEITPSYTAADGRKVTGETASVTYDGNGQHVSSSLDVEKFKRAPTVRVMSSNILIADARGYHKDDIHNATGEVYDPAKDDGRNSTKIYKDGLNYYWYFRDDNAGEYFGRENGVAGTGLMDEPRMEQMALMYAAYQPDFIGLQEVYGGTVINTTPTINMQQTLLSYLPNNYAYVDFSNKVSLDAHYTPILYRTDKWRVIDKDIADEQWVEYANEMHRWNWAVFESLENSEWKFIVLNLHGPNNLAGADTKEFQPTFYARLNEELKMLESKYSGVAIAVTGDFNQTLSSAMVSTMLAGTSLSHTMTLTENQEYHPQGIDHIFITSELATPEQCRMVDNKILRKSSDHSAVFTDFVLKKKK